MSTIEDRTGWFRKNCQHAQVIVNNPAILPFYLKWFIQKRIGGNPNLRIFGCEFRDFPNFNAYLGTWHYKPDAEEMDFLRSFINGAHVILDVGANFGVISCIAGRLNPAAQIYAFEPHPETAASLRRNLERNGMSQVSVIQKAVSSKSGEIGFTSHGSRESPATNRIVQDTRGDISVQVTTLSEFCDSHKIQRIDFLKVDVEGADVDVLEGGRALFEAGRIGRGMIEVCPGTLTRFGRSVADMIAFFDSVGFDLKWYTVGGTLGEYVSSHAAEERGTANAAFLPKQLCR